MHPRVHGLPLNLWALRARRRAGDQEARAHTPAPRICVTHVFRRRHGALSPESASRAPTYKERAA